MTAAARASRGFALVEAVVAIALVVTVAIAIMAQMSQANDNSARGLLQSQAAAIADAYLDEICARPWADPDGIDGEGARRLFDDVDDYANLHDVGARDANGALIPGLNRYDVRVSVAPSSALPGVPAANVLRVVVTVTDPAGSPVLAAGYRVAP